MSELIYSHDNRTTIRWKLLTGASALALTAYVASAAFAKAEDADRPLVWIELGGQLEQVQGDPERFAPPFVSQIDTSAFQSPIALQRPQRFSEGFEGALSFQPDNSDWSFSAAIRYGRSSGARNVHQQSAGPGTAPKYFSVPLFGIYGNGTVAPEGKRYVTTVTRNTESHAVLDFQAGKDVGLGLFGNSTVRAGVRFAQFTLKSQASLMANDFHFSYPHYTHIPTGAYSWVSANITLAVQKWHDDGFIGNISQSFHGVGPSLAWDGSTRLAGNGQAAELMFDWGVNAALLFGRQKVRGHEKTDSVYRAFRTDFNRFYAHTFTLGSYHHAHNIDRSRSATVPNVGGFAGVSFKYNDAKISFGYRADFFFNAVDGGVDVRKTFNRSFYGPFATISVGLGG